MAGSFPGIVRRKGTYYARIVVPQDVRHLFDSGELWQTLKTNNFVEARRTAPPVIADFKRRIAAARRGAAHEDRTQPARIALARWTVIEARKPDENAEPCTHTPWEVHAKTESLRRAWNEAEGWRDIPNFDATLVNALAVGGLRVSLDDPVIPLFRQEAALTFMYAKLARERDRLSQALRLRAEAVSTTDLDDGGATFKVPESVPPPPSLTIRKLFDAWVESVKPAEKERGRLDHQIRRLIEIVGDRPANHLKKAEIEEFMGLVARFPGRKRPANLNALALRELIEEFEADNAKRNDPWKTLSKATAGEWFAGFNRMYAYAVRMELIEKNPWQGLNFTIRGGESVDRRAYTDEEIKKIFTSPLFQGYAPWNGPMQARFRDTPGTTITKDAKYWLPILALFHAQRLSEFAALPLANFKADGEVRYFDLTMGVSVKNAQSMRVIPLHPYMREIGFLDYVDGLHAAGEMWLFPDLNHLSKLGAGHEVSKWWGQWLNKRGLVDPTLTFHSFRHTWKRRARASEVKEEMHDIISGHKPVNIARGYGAGAEITDLAREMAKITFPEFPSLP
jgi:integrase